MKRCLLLTSLFLFLFSALHSQSLSESWAATAGGSGSEEGRSLAVTANAVYAVGNFTSASLTMGSQTLTNAGLNDIFVAKYDLSGNVVWATRFGGFSDDRAHSISVGPDGSLYISGSFVNSITLGTNTLTAGAGAQDVFIVKLDNSGNILWARQLDLLAPATSTFQSQLIADPYGDVYMGGNDPTTVPQTTYLMKWSGTGNTIFQKTIDGSFTSISLDENNFVHLAFYSSTITLASGPPENKSYTVSFFARAWYDTTGYLKGAESLAGTNSRIRPLGYTARSVSEFFHASQFIPTGADARTIIPLYLTGSLTGEASTNYYHLKSVTNPVYDRSGNEFYAGTYPVGLTTSTDTMAILSFGRLVDSTQGADIFLVQKTGASGVVQLIATRRYGNVNDTAYQLAISPAGDALYVIGDWAKRTASSQYVFGNSVLSNAGGSDMLLLKFTITQQPLAISAGLDKTICLGGSTTIGNNQVSGGKQPYTYSWLPNENISNTSSPNPTVHPSAETSYILTVTDAEGAVVKDTVVIKIDSSYRPVIQASGAVPFCEGSSVTLSSPIQSKMVWSTGEENGSIVVRTPGSYTLTATTAQGCIGTSLPFVVTVNPRPATPSITSSGSTTFCSGDSVTLTAQSSESNVQYRWINPQNAVLSNAASLLVKSATTYSTYVQNAAGCTSLHASQAIVVSALPAVSISASGPLNFCSNDSLLLTAQTAAGNTLLWSNGLQAASVWVKSAGTYSAQATNAAGCKATSNSLQLTTTTAPAKPVITQSGNTLTSSATAGNQWLLNGVPVTGATAQQYSVQSSGIYTVQTTQNGCTARSEVFNFVATGLVDPGSWNNEVLLYPNPVQNNLYITNTAARKLKVQVTDMQGKSVLLRQFTTTAATLNLDKLAAGNYLILITDERKKETIQKIIFKQ